MQTSNPLLLYHSFFVFPGGQEVVEEQKWFAGKDGGRRELSGPALHYLLYMDIQYVPKKMMQRID